MNKNSDPLESIIDFAWGAGADLFFVQNAKDELKKLRDKNKEWASEVYRANEFAVEQTSEYLEVHKQMQALKDCIESPVAWARINDHGDLFDLRLQNNPYVDQNTVTPLYRLKS
jgi:hypothetical protein